MTTIHTVNSSAISQVAYDNGKSALFVMFSSGKCWRYEGVPYSAYTSLLTADSVGGYFSRKIRHSYEGHESEMPDPNATPAIDLSKLDWSAAGPSLVWGE